MTWLIVAGILFIMVITFITVVIFFQGASRQTITERQWEELQQKMAPEYNFKFYGDCGAPRSLEKAFSPCRLSSNAMMGTIKGEAKVDVYDFTLSDGSGSEAPRVHGLIFQAEKAMLNLRTLDTEKKISINSVDGDYQVVASPNKNYLYILIVDDYFPITYDSVDWHSADNMNGTLRKDLDIIYRYMDKFCLVEREAA